MSLPMAFFSAGESGNKREQASAPDQNIGACDDVAVLRGQILNAEAHTDNLYLHFCTRSKLGLFSESNTTLPS